MLARVTYGLVGLALVTLIAGFFQRASNALLYISIALSIAAIILVLIGAARRAREVPATGAAPEPVGDEEAFEREEVPTGALLTLEDEGEEIEDEDEYLEDEEAEEEEEEEEEPEEIEVVPRRRTAATTTRRAATTTRRAPASQAPARRTTTRQPAARTRTTPARAAAAPSRRAAKPARATSSKVVVVPGRDRYHTQSCRFIQDKDDIEEIAGATAKRRGYQPCSVCKPA